MASLIVDGYNIVHAWPELARTLQRDGLEAARAALVSALGEYAAATHCEVTVVFDSNRGRGSTEQVDGVEVRFASKSASADHVIERLIYQATRRGEGAEITVATSDRLQGDLVRVMGVATISALALRSNVVATLVETTQRAKRLETSAHHGRSLGERLDVATRDALERLRRGEQ